MNILISGAGVAGLALAGFLKKHDVKVDIIDSAKAFRNIGYTVLMWPIGGRILNKLELTQVERRKLLFSIFNPTRIRVVARSISAVSSMVTSQK